MSKRNSGTYVVKGSTPFMSERMGATTIVVKKEPLDNFRAMPYEDYKLIFGIAEVKGSQCVS